jgi:hypothetical protein
MHALQRSQRPPLEDSFDTHGTLSAPFIEGPADFSVWILCIGLVVISGLFTSLSDSKVVVRNIQNHNDCIYRTTESESSSFDTCS